MRNKYIASIVAIIGGTFGLHKIYLGKWIQWVFYMIFSFTFIPTILGIVEGILYILNSSERFDLNYNLEYMENKKKYDNLQL